MTRKAWFIKTSHGFLDIMLYKTVMALGRDRTYAWKTEKGARKAFENIHLRFPKVGPTYELWEGTETITEHTWGHDDNGKPLTYKRREIDYGTMIDSKTVA